MSRSQESAGEASAGAVHGVGCQEGILEQLKRDGM